MPNLSTYQFIYVYAMKSSTLTPLLNQRDKLVLAREIIDLYYDDRSNAQTVESLSRICFTLARLFETTNDTRAPYGMTYSIFLTKNIWSLQAVSNGMRREKLKSIRYLNDCSVIYHISSAASLSTAPTPPYPNSASGHLFYTSTSCGSG